MQTSNYLYRPVLRKAFEITKKFNSLWLFGLFAVLVSAGGEYEILTRALYNSENNSIINAFVVSFQSGWQEGAKLVTTNFWQNMGQFLWTDSGSVAMALFVFVFIVTLTLFVIWLSVASQIALIKGSSLASKNKKISIVEGVEFANRNFFPILAVIAVLKIALFVLFGLLGWEIILLAGGGIFGIIIYVLSFIVFTLAVLIISFILKYQTFFILLKKQKFMTALQSAWELFKENWLISLEMALIMFGVYLLATVISAFIITLCSGITIVVIPYYFFGIADILKWTIAALSVILMLVGVFFVTAIMTTFQWAGWTVLFEKLAGGEESSKLERIGASIKQIPSALFGK